MTDARSIDFLWTHRTQAHPDLSDEDLHIVRGEGVYVWNQAGKRLLDGFSGLAVMNVGHGRREIADAVREQTLELAYYPTTQGFSNPPAAELAAKLADLTPGDLRYTLFAVSGSEANERSMQIARHYWLRRGHPGKYKVVSLDRAYHGATQGTLGICGIPSLVRPYEPYQLAGFVKVPPPYPLHERGAGGDAAVIDRAASRLADAIHREGRATVSAVILEPVISAGGFIVPPLGWLRMVREICDDLDVLMIADEVITGFGRTGKWFGVEHEDVVPDLMSVAKGITSGYIPLSASIARGRLADAFPEGSQEENVHPNTYAGHPVACAAALANLQIMEKEGLVDNAAAMGRRLREGLQELVGSQPVVGEVRGRGLMVCVDFVQPDGSGRPLTGQPIEDLNTRAWERGAIVSARGSVLRLAPPLCITPGEVEELAGIVADTVLELARAHPGAGRAAA